MMLEYEFGSTRFDVSEVANAQKCVDSLSLNLKLEPSTNSIDAEFKRFTFLIKVAILESNVNSIVWLQPCSLFGFSTILSTVIH